MAEGTQVYDDMLGMLQQRGVQPTGANIAAALSGVLSQPQSIPQPVAMPVVDATAQQTGKVAGGQRSPTRVPSAVSAQPERSTPDMRGGAPSSGAQPVSGSMSMAEVIGALLSGLGLGGLGVAAMRSGKDAPNTTPTSKPPAMPVEGEMPRDMSVKGPSMTGPSSPLAPMSDVATREEYRGNAAPRAPNTTPQTIRDALTGSNLANIDWANSGVNDPAGTRIPTPPNMIKPDAVSQGPLQELQRMLQQNGLTVDQLPDHMKPVFTNPEAARTIADRPNVWRNLLEELGRIATRVRR